MESLLNNGGVIGQRLVYSPVSEQAPGETYSIVHEDFESGISSEWTGATGSIERVQSTDMEGSYKGRLIGGDLEINIDSFGSNPDYVSIYLHRNGGSRIPTFKMYDGTNYDMLRIAVGGTDWFTNNESNSNSVSGVSGFAFNEFYFDWSAQTVNIFQDSSDLGSYPLSITKIDMFGVVNGNSNDMFFDFLKEERSGSVP